MSRGWNGNFTEYEKSRVRVMAAAKSKERKEEEEEAMALSLSVSKLQRFMDSTQRLCFFSFSFSLLFWNVQSTINWLRVPIESPMTNEIFFLNRDK